MKDKTAEFSGADHEETRDPKSAVTEVSSPSAVDNGIEAWWSQFVRNSAIARDTPAYNHLRRVLPELSKLINEEMNK